MASRRPPKKSDPLVVRMPHEDKEAFLDACRRDERTASDVVRDLIAGYVRRQAMRERLRDVKPERSLVMIWKSPKTRIAAAASAAAGALASVALLSAPSAAQFDYRASFESLDANRDGVITLEEYAGGGSLSTLAIDLEPPSDGAPRPVTVAGAGARQGVVQFTLDAAAPHDVEEVTVDIQEQQSIMRWMLRMDIGFGEADADGDGSVDFDEFVDRHQQLFADEFVRRDGDADGRLTASELMGNPAAADEAPGPSPLFDALDLNGDGAITLEELQAEPA